MVVVGEPYAGKCCRDLDLLSFDLKMQGVNLCSELHLNIINLVKFPQAVCKNRAKNFITHARTDRQTTAKHNTPGG